jgi:methenyltetrahydromethanopterin cyclohydrolase
MISVNERAASIVQQMCNDSEALGLSIFRLSNGTTVVDAGVKVPGSMEAGRLFSCACLGGLGEVSFTQQRFHGEDAGVEFSFWLPAVGVSVNLPHIACMASQYAGWSIKLGRYFAIGSGPARALYAGEGIFSSLIIKIKARRPSLCWNTSAAR